MFTKIVDKYRVIREADSQILSFTSGLLVGSAIGAGALYATSRKVDFTKVQLPKELVLQMIESGKPAFITVDGAPDMIMHLASSMN